jgi:hypothetical protein
MAVKSWLVRYRRSCEGEAVVDARTAEEAAALVESGGFDYDPTEEMFDWEVIGEPEENA